MNRSRFLASAFPDPGGDWVRLMNEVFESLDGPELAHRLLRVLRRLAPFDRGVLRVSRRDGAHRIVFDSSRAGVTHWLDEPGAPSPASTGCDLVPLHPGDRRAFAAGDVRGSHVAWAPDGAPQFAYTARVSDDTFLCLLLLCKPHEAALEARDIERLEHIGPTVHRALTANWRLWGAASIPLDVSRSGLGRVVESALQAFGASQLTPRERDVIGLLLVGRSARRAAAELGIAEATVALHRKRAYAKLGVGSQGELFARFLRTLDRPDS